MKQTILVDFYNLHLTEEDYPLSKETERRIRVFFSVYSPNVVRQLTEDQKRSVAEYRETTDDKLMGIVIDDLQRKRGVTEKHLELQHYLKQNLSAYANSTTIDGYKVKTGEDWFTSDKLRSFLTLSNHVGKIVDGRLDGSIELASLAYLEELYNGIPTAFWISGYEIAGTPKMLLWIGHTTLEKGEKSWRINLRASDAPRWGIQIDELIRRFVWETISYLEGKVKIKRCAAPATQRTPKCQNVFIARMTGGKKQKYCSTKCSDRTRNFGRKKKKLRNIQRKC